MSSWFDYPGNRGLGAYIVSKKPQAPTFPRPSFLEMDSSNPFANSTIPFSALLYPYIPLTCLTVAGVFLGLLIIVLIMKCWECNRETEEYWQQNGGPPEPAGRIFS